MFIHVILFVFFAGDFLQRGDGRNKLGIIASLRCFSSETLLINSDFDDNQADDDDGAQGSLQDVSAAQTSGRLPREARPLRNLS